MGNSQPSFNSIINYTSDDMIEMGNNDIHNWSRVLYLLYKNIPGLMYITSKSIDWKVGINIFDSKALMPQMPQTYNYYMDFVALNYYPTSPIIYYDVNTFPVPVWTLSKSLTMCVIYIDTIILSTISPGDFVNIKVNFVTAPIVEHIGIFDGGFNFLVAYMNILKAQRQQMIDSQPFIRTNFIQGIRENISNNIIKSSTIIDLEDIFYDQINTTITPKTTSIPDTNTDVIYLEDSGTIKTDIVNLIISKKTIIILSRPTFSTINIRYNVTKPDCPIPPPIPTMPSCPVCPEPVPKTVGSNIPNFLGLPNNKSFGMVLYIMLIVFLIGGIISGIIVNLLK